MTKNQRKKWRAAVEKHALEYPCETCSRGPGWRCVDRRGDERKAHAARFRHAARWLPARLDPTSATFCGCDGAVPCLAHVEGASDHLLNSPSAMAADLASIPGMIDMAGPDDDEMKSTKPRS